MPSLIAFSVRASSFVHAQRFGVSIPHAPTSPTKQLPS
jgi:hypothetical protein